MKTGFRLLPFCVAMLLGLPACKPPAALRQMVGKDRAPPAVAAGRFPAPEPPNRPAEWFFGTLVQTNETSWGTLLKRGQATKGALVLDVIPNTPAQKLGLQAGDIISRVDGKTINNHEQLLVTFRESSTPEHRIQVKRVDGAIQTFDAQLATSTGFSLLSYLEQKAQTSPDAVTRFLLAEQLPDDNRAIELIRAVNAEYPSFAQGRSLLARRLLDRLQTAQGDTTLPLAPSPELQEVQDLVDAAARLDPEAPSILRARSQIFLTLLDGARAESEAAKALQIDRFSAEANYLLGTARLTLGQPQEALEPLYKAVRLDPYTLDYYVNLAICYRQLGRATDAASTIEAAKALVTDPALRQRLDDLLNPSGSGN